MRGGSFVAGQRNMRRGAARMTAPRRGGSSGAGPSSAGVVRRRSRILDTDSESDSDDDDIVGTTAKRGRRNSRR